MSGARSMPIDKNELVIMLVDDQSSMRNLLAATLQGFGINKIIHARNGEEALKTFKLKKPDMTFLDINMPDINGLVLLKELIRTEREAFIVMVSGDSTVANVKSAITNGSKGFIVKPYTPGKIAAMLKKFDPDFEVDGLP